MIMSTIQDKEKLDYAARLSGLLLNDGTDVMRWFLMDNLPRRISEEPDLSTILGMNRNLFEKILDDDALSQKLHFCHDMFDILYPLAGIDIDLANMEISLLFLLIRYLCRIKSSTWKWWDENPCPHQTVPIFDIIRLVRFKEKMKAIVHDYQVDEKTYRKSIDYVKRIIERLRGFKSSTKRWEQEVISYNKDENITKQRKTLDLVAIMRWQTMDVRERNATYLVLKENLFHLTNDLSECWPSFISRFGQMKNFDVCKVNNPNDEDDDKRYLVVASNNPRTRDYLKSSETSEMELNWELINDVIWKKASQGSFGFRSFTKVRKKSVDRDFHISLPPAEKIIYDTVDDSIFITTPSDSSPFIGKIREGWRKKAINCFSSIKIFPYHSCSMRPIEDIRINICNVSLKRFNSWTDVLRPQSNNIPMRIVLRGSTCIGKTTALKKIAHQCATNNIPALANYDLVFYVDLSTVTVEHPYTKMMEYVKRHSLKLNTDIPNDAIEKIAATRNGDGILFLLDNFDLLGMTEEFYEIWDIVKSDRWSNCGIITTTTVDLNKASDTGKRLYSATVDSKVEWQYYILEGFRNSDVKKEAHNFFGDSSVRLTNGEKISFARHVSNLLRIYHKDIYDCQYKSPILTTILCNAFQQISSRKSVKHVPRSLCQVFEAIFETWMKDQNLLTSEFLSNVLDSTFLGIRFFPDIDLYVEETQCLQPFGILQTLNDSKMKFSHPLFQDFLSAKMFSFTRGRWELKKYIKSANESKRLREFLVFCCEINSEVTNEVVEILCKLIDNYPEQKDELLALCKLCFHASSLGNSDSSHCTITSAYEKDVVCRKEILDKIAEDDDNSSDLITARLDLNGLFSMKSSHCASILTFVRACRPGLTQSGTVFPLMRSVRNRRETSYICELQVSDFGNAQTRFVKSVVHNLPFLISLSLTNIIKLSPDNFQGICNSIKPAPGKLVSPLQSVTISFKSNTRFDKAIVPLYHPMSSIFHGLPFLECFHISPLSYHHFSSLFDNSCVPIPIIGVDLAANDISEERCSTLATCFERIVFLHVLNLSNNPIYGGLPHLHKAFTKFSVLQILHLEQCCLSNNSVYTLSQILTETQLPETLQTLNLNGNHIDDQSSLMQLVEAIGSLTQLRNLDLSRNFLGDRVVCVLSSKLCLLPEMLQLKLDYVQMGQLGLNAIKSCLTQFSRLEILHLGSNPLPNDAIRLISELNDCQCKIGDTLKELSLSGLSCDLPIRVTSKAVKGAARSITSFKNLRKLKLANTVLSYFEVLEFLRMVDNHPLLRTIELSDDLTPLNQEERKCWKCLVTT